MLRNTMVETKAPFSTHWSYCCTTSALPLVWGQSKALSVCVCVRVCAHAVERWPGIYFTQQFSPCMRWGVVHLLDSFFCLALTWTVHKVIRAAWDWGELWWGTEGWCNKVLQRERKGQPASWCVRRLNYGGEGPYCRRPLWPWSPDVLPSKKRDIGTFVTLVSSFTEISVWMQCSRWRWVLLASPGNNPECVLKMWQVDSMFFCCFRRTMSFNRVLMDAKWNQEE